ncbi:MAG: hypothetical protein ACI9K5_000421 [Gammaproteobacteria bacterium]|jgi:hypothetical protein
MADATRGIGSDGLIPMPRQVARVRARSEKDGHEGQGEQEFAEELKTLRPVANRRSLSRGNRELGSSIWARKRPDRRDEGLGSDLDLLG